MNHSRRSQHSRRLSFQTLETRRVFDANSQLLLDGSYRAETNESAVTDQGIFFVRDDARYGTELWTTNASGADPHLVVDLTTGPAGSRLRSLTAVDGGVYFLYSADDDREQLWWSDGTAQNTRLVADRIASFDRSYLDEGIIRPLPNDGQHVFFMKWTVGEGYSYLNTGLWAASNQGADVRQLTDRSSFGDTVDGTWEPWKVQSFQETGSSLSVFILEANKVDGAQANASGRFFGITDGTPSGTKLSSYEPSDTTYLLSAVSLSNDKLMFVARSNEASTVLTIDKNAKVEQLNQSYTLPMIEFQKSGSQWFFSMSSENQLSLFRTDGTASGTQVVGSAGAVHSSPVILSDGSVLTLAGVNFYDRDFQVTDPVTLTTSKLDFITPSEAGVIRELFGTIAVGLDKFFYVETKGDNARRLMMADMRSKTVSTVLDGGYNEAISAPIVREDYLYFSHVTASHSDLIRYNTVTRVSSTLASIQTDAWQGLSIDLVEADQLVGFMNEAEHASIFKLRFSDEEVGVISLVDEVVSPTDHYFHFIPRRYSLTFSRIDDQTVALPISIQINGQFALQQMLALDTSSTGLTKLLPSTLPQPSLHSIFDETQFVFRAGGKLVYHSGNNADQLNGLVQEIWSAKDGQAATKLIDTKAIPGAQLLVPLGVLNDRFYFLSMGSKTVLYRTNEDATSVDVVTETPWNTPFYSSYYFEILYRPETPNAPQRILFRTSGDANDPEVWEITEDAAPLKKIVEPSVLNPSSEPDNLSYDSNRIGISAGSLVLAGAPFAEPLVEVVPLDSGSDRMVPFFGESSLLSDAEKQTARLYRLEDAWVAVVPGPNDTYSFWSRPDDASEATRVSELDLKPFKKDYYPIYLTALATTPEAIVFFAATKLIRLDRDGTYSFVDVPGFENADANIGFAGRLVDGTDGFHQPRPDALFRVGDSQSTDHVYALSADARTVQEISIEGQKHGKRFEQLFDGTRHFVLATGWANLPLKTITRELQNTRTVALSLDQSEANVVLSAGQVVVQTSEGVVHQSAASELNRLSIQSTNSTAVTFDLGNVTDVSAFPFNGISISLAEQSVLKLIGTSVNPVVYSFENDHLTIRIGALTLRVLDPGDLTVVDMLNVIDRTWQFTSGDDDIEIRPNELNATEFVDRSRNVIIRVVEPANGEGESPIGGTAQWRIDTRTGRDHLAIAPEVSAAALLSIVSDLDSNSNLSINLPAMTGTLGTTQENGRSFVSTTLADLQIKVDNSRRPEHNLANPNDANNDGVVSALDALRIINTMSRRRKIGRSSADVIFGDTSGDGQISALDALRVINHLSRQNQAALLAGEAIENRKKISQELDSPAYDNALGMSFP